MRNGSAVAAYKIVRYKAKSKTPRKDLERIHEMLPKRWNSKDTQKIYSEIGYTMAPGRVWGWVMRDIAFLIEAGAIKKVPWHGHLSRFEKRALPKDPTTAWRYKIVKR